ncbi:hypothetical protein OG792_01680 [Micromonospora sp. NBC_01699]|uniref:hypothetical protein n=1 Tax=Micromonospora sp. NBC_01699 TaxID=2975984 RepID=UPI002E2A6938|nr:hypothetical protein [Micromonospora sp. NBC_01699]
MSLDRELSTGTQRPTEEPNGPPARDAPVSRATLIGYATVAVALFGWFLFGWLVERQGFVNSVGEAAGTAFTLLLVIAIVGTLRRSRH